jgi:hypothetical protein
MNQPVNVDLAGLSFDGFVQFFFDHPEDEQFWYADPRYALADISISGPLLLEHLTTLFQNFAAATSKYSPVQISHGIWAMFSPSFSLIDTLWDAAIPVEKRTECIRSMARVFADFVSANDAESLQKCFYMWWHIVVTGFWAHQEQFGTPDVSQLAPEAVSLNETMFETLKQILAVPDPRVQGYALHGLGHLQHPGVRDLVQHYIDQNKGRFTEEHVQWMEQCRDGVVS